MNDAYPSTAETDETPQRYKLSDSEYHLMEIIWELEPITSTELHKACLPRLGWKKSTTYTMLRKLCERSLLSNQDSVVTSLIKRKDVEQFDSRELVDKRFGHSLPKFVAAFLSEQTLSSEEADELQKLIHSYREKK